VTPTWVRWAMPSIADLIFVAIFAVLVLTPLSVKLLNDAGIGWHIRTGQQILATHSIPRVDPFSSQIRKPWIAWEWLYDVVVSSLERSAGLNGVVWFTAVVIAGTFAVVFRMLLRRGTNLVIALVLTLLAISSSMIHFLARPHVLSWFFALASFWILDSTETAEFKHDRRLWILPLLMVVWTNVHGGFLLGFVLLAIYWSGSLWTWLRLKEARIEESLQKIVAGKRTRELIVVGVVTAVASLVNPYGWRLHAHIYCYLTNRFFMDHIDEFQSPNFHGIAQRCFLAILLITVAALAACGRKVRLSQILLVLFSVYAGLYASRNIPIASIFLVLIVGPVIPSIGLGGFSQRIRSLDAVLRGHIWPAIAVVASLAILLNGGRVGSIQLMDAHFDPHRMPVAAVNFVQNSGARGPVLSPDYWGGYLIYRLYPHNRVVIDDRHDFYGEPFLRSYLTNMHVEPGWERFLEKHSACLVLPRKTALAAILGISPEWKTTYSDDIAVVFVTSKIPADRDRASGH
jgi:hypothetical protein